MRDGYVIRTNLFAGFVTLIAYTAIDMFRLCFNCSAFPVIERFKRGRNSNIIAGSFGDCAIPGSSAGGDLVRIPSGGGYAVPLAGGSSAQRHSIRFEAVHEWRVLRIRSSCKCSADDNGCISFVDNLAPYGNAYNDFTLREGLQREGVSNEFGQAGNNVAQ